MDGAAICSSLRSLRQAAGLTQVQLAARWPGTMSQGRLGSYERGEQSPTLDTLVCWLRAGGWTLEDLVRESRLRGIDGQG
jgi:transcriptional regulator with XRE-family HTH domain